jgi:CDGSH-type Zn-finger protein
MTEARVASRPPIAVEVAAGKTYWWCTCGRSSKQPFCDGSHQGTGFTPMRWDCERSERKWFCGCKRTRQAPFCDGSHKELPA